MASLAVAFFALFLVGLTCATSPQVPIGGGFSDTPKPADAGVQKAVDAVANQIRTKADLPKDSKLTVRKYISQVVAGTNYVVEVQPGGTRSAVILHVKISADLQGKVFTLNGVKKAVIGQALKTF